MGYMKDSEGERLDQMDVPHQEDVDAAQTVADAAQAAADAAATEAEAAQAAAAAAQADVDVNELATADAQADADAAAAAAAQAQAEADTAQAAVTALASQVTAAQADADAAQSDADDAAGAAAAAQADADQAQSEVDIEEAAARNADNLTSGTVNPARTTTRNLPAYAGVRRNPYNPRLCAYNWKPSNTRKLRSGLAKAQAGLARSHLLFIGDSATDARTGGVGVYDRLNAWPLVMRDIMAVKEGMPIGGDGVIFAARPGGAQDPRVVAAGGWNQTSFAYATVSASGATLTFTPVNPCTTVEVWYSRNSGTFTASMDGASSGSGYAAVTPDGGTGWAKVTLTGTLGLHTVVFTTTSSSATSCANINAYADAGLVVQNAGYSGSSVNDWITYTAWYQLAGVTEGTTPSPRDAVFFALGGNDIILHGRTPTQMKADMETLLDRWAPYYGDQVLVVPNQAWSVSVPNATWDEWAGYLYDLADDYDIPLIDYYARVGSNTEATTVGFHSLDATHMNSAGYRDQGRHAASILGS